MKPLKAPKKKITSVSNETLKLINSVFSNFLDHFRELKTRVETLEDMQKNAVFEVNENFREMTLYYREEIARLQHEIDNLKEEKKNAIAN